MFGFWTCQVCLQMSLIVDKYPALFGGIGKRKDKVLESMLMRLLNS